MHQLFENTTPTGENAISTESGIGNRRTISIDSSSCDDYPEIYVTYTEPELPGGISGRKTITPQKRALGIQESPSPQDISTTTEYQPHYKLQKRSRATGMQTGILVLADSICRIADSLTKVNDTQVANKTPSRSKEDESPTRNTTGNPPLRNLVLGPLTPLDCAVALLTSMVEGGTLTKDKFLVRVNILSKNPDQL